MKLINSEVRIETTNKCNSRCTMCPREKLNRPIGVMYMKLFGNILEEIRHYGVTNVFLGGYGEALLDPHIVERVKMVKDLGLFANFISNGSLMKEKVAKDLIQAGLDEVRFSFYGSTKEVYEEVHEGLSYEVTRNNIRNLMNLKKEMGGKTPMVYVFFLLLDANKHQVEEFKKDWAGVVDAIEVWKPHNFGDGRMFREKKQERKSCGRPQRGPVQIQWDGTLIPCCWDYDGKMILGDLKKNSLKDILNGKQYEDIRNAHSNGEFERYPFCDNCDQLNSKKDALVYSNRHSLSPEDAVKLANSNLFSLK